VQALIGVGVPQTSRAGVFAPDPPTQPVAAVAVHAAQARVSFEEASTVFGDPMSLTVPDPAHSEAEDRFIIMGRSHQRKLLVVVHTERGDNIRVVSARRASRKERKIYEESSWQSSGPGPVGGV
jgi:uncharacterized DUF497 family protein